MKSYSTSDRLHQIMTARNLRQVDIISLAEPYCKKFDVRLGKNALSQYVSGKVEPGQDKLTILGMALNVSEAWLMGYDVSPERKETPTVEEDDGRLREFTELFSLLTDDQKDMILHAIKGLLSDR